MPASLGILPKPRRVERSTAQGWQPQNLFLSPPAGNGGDGVGRLALLALRRRLQRAEREGWKGGFGSENEGGIFPSFTPRTSMGGGSAGAIPA